MAYPEQTIPKDPESILDFSVDLTNLLQAGESIVTSSWSTPAGLTEITEVLNSPFATVWLSGGTLGQKYEVKNTSVTNSSPARTFVNRLIIPIVKK